MKEYTYLKRVEMKTSDLKVGMYVGKLDKDWKDSPFLFQGFPIEDESQLAALKRECKTVFVDFKTQEEYDIFLLNAGDEVEVDSFEGKDDTSLVKELPRAAEAYSKSVKAYQSIVASIQTYKSLSLAKVEASVEKLIESIAAQPDALLMLTNIKNLQSYELEHPVRVAAICLAFANHLKLSEEQMRVFGIGAMLLDIGKLSIPAAILNKADRLNKAEALVLKDHPHESYKLLNRIPGLSAAIKDIVLSHHEREDGKGYPRHMPKDRVSRYAKIVAIVDTYDALTSDRPFRKAASPNRAFAILNRNSGTKYDPQIVKLFCRWLGRYPIGALVEMVSGEVGFIIKNTPDKPESPRIMLVTDEQKQAGYHKIVDLSRMDIHSSGKPYRVKESLENGAFGINVADHLEKQLFDVPSWVKTGNVRNDSPFAKYME